MSRFILVTSWAVISLISQLNIQRSSHILSDIQFTKELFRYLIVVFQMLSLAGLSLLMTAWCYRYFKLMDFIVAQTIFYLIVVTYSYFFQELKPSIREMIGVALISVGAAIYTFK